MRRFHLTVNEAGHVRSWSPGLAEALGHTRKQFSALALWDLSPDAKPEQMPGRVALVHELGAVQNTIRLVSRAGEEVVYDPKSYREPTWKEGGPGVLAHFWLGQTQNRVTNEGRPGYVVRGKEASLVCAGRGDAMSVAAKIGGDGQTSEPQTLGELIDLYANSPTFRARSEGHRAQSIRYIQRLIEHAGWKAIPDMHATGLESFVNAFVEKGQYEAANHAIARVKAWTTWLKNREVLEVDPFRHVEQVKFRRPPSTRCPTEDEVRRLIAVGNKMAERGDFYMMMALSGLRGGEVSKLQWKHVHLSDAPHVRLTADMTKSGKDERVPLHPELVAMLGRRRAHGPGADVKVFGPAPQGKVFDKDLARAGIEKKTGDGKLTLHQMRKFFATSLAKAGVSPTVSQRLLRHADVRTTLDVYTDARMLEMGSAVQKIPNLLGNGLDTGAQITDTANVMIASRDQYDTPAHAADRPGDHDKAAGAGLPSSASFDDAHAPKARTDQFRAAPDSGANSWKERPNARSADGRTSGTRTVSWTNPPAPSALLRQSEQSTLPTPETNGSGDGGTSESDTGSGPPHDSGHFPPSSPGLGLSPSEAAEGEREGRVLGRPSCPARQGRALFQSPAAWRDDTPDGFGHPPVNDRSAHEGRVGAGPAGGVEATAGMMAGESPATVPLDDYARSKLQTCREHGAETPDVASLNQRGRDRTGDLPDPNGATYHSPTRCDSKPSPLTRAELIRQLSPEQVFGLLNILEATDGRHSSAPSAGQGGGCVPH